MPQFTSLSTGLTLSVKLEMKIDDICLLLKLTFSDKYVEKTIYYYEHAWYFEVTPLHRKEGIGKIASLSSNVSGYCMQFKKQNI